MTVGWHRQPFLRLVDKMDEIAGRIDEEVVIQKGYTDYDTKHATSFDFLPSDKQYLEYFKNARIVVCHAGAGTLLNSLSFGKTTIVMPRLKKYEEHINDHQLELVGALKVKKGLIVVLEAEALEAAIANADSNPILPVESDLTLCKYIRKYLNDLSGP
ncbi:MAG TPA: glycosyltransferase [Methanomassiliicoccales archaeon]|nr:glycosyltransferase [Methanomassiliicoccales archaeon]